MHRGMSSYAGFPAESSATPDQPSAVVNAVRLMYVGAGLSLLGLIISLFGMGDLRARILEAEPSLTLSQANLARNIAIGGAIVFGLIGPALWIWMAIKNNEGRNWARITATVLFGVYTLSMLSLLFGNAGSSAIDVIFQALIWVVGLVATILMWRGENAEHYAPRQFMA